jgi:predicted glycoside hydrolase/deacetylase ChbG (UPF0249 family)
VAQLSVRLVVTADDFGLSPAVNRGVQRAHLDGIVTSASLMVRRHDAGHAAHLARAMPRLSLGLHLELVDYEVADGEWRIRSCRADPADATAVRRELAEQLDAFERLVGSPPAHLDSHHHLHQQTPVAELVAAAARRLGVPVRGSGPWRYRGDFYGQYGAGCSWPSGISVPSLVQLIGSLPPGVTELACHPADGPHGAHGTYDEERAVELATLCDPSVAAALRDNGVQLIGSCGVVQPNRPDT